jgi:hypothetical protein
MKIRNVYFMILMTILISTKPTSFSERIKSGFNWLTKKFDSGIKNIQQKYTELKELIIRHPKKVY